MTQVLTAGEVQLHNTKEDLYLIINNNVYDATSFVEEHPGGYDVLLEVAGQDATEPYLATDHSEEADDILSDFKIGTLDLSVKSAEKKDEVKIDTVEVEPEVIEGIEPPPVVLSQATAKEDITAATITVLKPDIFQEFKLESKTEISHNVAIYRFTLPTPTSTFGLPIGQHISIGAYLPQSDGITKEVIRSYTPISGDHQPGFFDLLIKTYPQGAITQHVSALSLGDTIRVRGPKGAFMYTPNMVRRFGMIAGGTGITPMLQIINAIRRGRTAGDTTQIDLIFANVDEQDILLKEELDVLVKEDEGIRVNYVLNNPPEGWTGGVGFVSKGMIEKWLPPPASDVKILLCGPPPMVGAMKKLTESLGYVKAKPASRLEDQVFAF